MLERLQDIRLIDYEKSPDSIKRALIRIGYLSMLSRANYDVKLGDTEVEEDLKLIEEAYGGEEVLFSPYQTLKSNVVNEALNIEIEKNKEENDHREVQVTKRIMTSVVNTEEQTLTIDQNTGIKKKLINDNVEQFCLEVVKKQADGKKLDDIIKELKDEHALDRITEFYPLIETLFRIMGVDCRKTREGVNGERWDAMIVDEKKSIPIEIKSPTEEMHISIKAIRQALENKIILLSRGTYPTTKECSSFAVGFYPPNKRAEVSTLIQDVKETYGIKIAVFDLESLLRAAVCVILQKKGIDIKKMSELEGIVNVTNIIF